MLDLKIFTINFGVPLESNLCPMLFLLIIDVETDTLINEKHLFAYNVKIYRTCVTFIKFALHANFV